MYQVGCALVTVVILYGHCGPLHGQESCGWGISSNSLGQCFTSSSTLTHPSSGRSAVLRRVPTTVGGVANGRRESNEHETFPT